MRSLYFIILFLFQVFTCLGQVFNEVTAECRYGREVSYEEAVRIATDKAKAIAVDRSYVDVSKFAILRGTTEKQLYTSKTTANSYAVVRVYDKKVNVRRNRVIVTISGEVYPTKARRVVDVYTNKKFYHEDEDLKFNVSFYRDSFLKIFWFDSETGDGGILYPLEGESSKRFVTNNNIVFPETNSISYVSLICPWVMSKAQKRAYYYRYGKFPPSNLRDEDLPAIGNATHGTWGKPSNKASEKHITIVFVTTESNIPFRRKIVNEESFFEWWCEIPINDRDALVKKHITLYM